MTTTDQIRYLSVGKAFGGAEIRIDDPDSEGQGEVHVCLSVCLSVLIARLDINFQLIYLNSVHYTSSEVSTLILIWIGRGVPTIILEASAQVFFSWERRRDNLLIASTALILWEILTILNLIERMKKKLF